jgi:hypothetical protein
MRLSTFSALRRDPEQEGKFVTYFVNELVNILINELTLAIDYCHQRSYMLTIEGFPFVSALKSKRFKHFWN